MDIIVIRLKKLINTWRRETTAAVVYTAERKANFNLSPWIFALNDKYNNNNNGSHQQRRYNWIPERPRKAQHSSYWWKHSFINGCLYNAVILATLPAQPMRTSSSSSRLSVFSAQQHIAYMLSALYATSRPSVRPSDGSSSNGSTFSGGSSNDSCNSNCTSSSKW